MMKLKQIVQKLKDIPGAFNGFGFLQVVQHFPKTGAGTTVSFNFLHFTMQEYLASLYVSTAILNEQQLSLMELGYVLD